MSFSGLVPSNNKEKRYIFALDLEPNIVQLLQDSSSVQSIPIEFVFKSNEYNHELTIGDRCYSLKSNNITDNADEILSYKQNELQREGYINEVLDVNKHTNKVITSVTKQFMEKPTTNNLKRNIIRFIPKRILQRLPNEITSSLPHNIGSEKQFKLLYDEFQLKYPLWGELQNEEERFQSRIEELYMRMNDIHDDNDDKMCIKIKIKSMMDNEYPIIQDKIRQIKILNDRLCELKYQINTYVKQWESDRERTQ